MLKIQELLKQINNLDQICDEYSLVYTKSKCGNMVILNYTTKINDVSSECRQLVLENNTWNVIGKSMYRFFDINDKESYSDRLIIEQSDDTYITPKIDGTIILMFYYNDKWHFCTRKSFCSENIWLSRIENIVGSIDNFTSKFDSNFSYVFELVSDTNRIISYYSPDKYGLYLLSISELKYPYNEIVDYDKLNLPIKILKSIKMKLNELLEMVKYPTNENISNYEEGYIISCVNENKIIRLKVKFDYWNTIHKIKGCSDDQQSTPILKLNTELYFLIIKYPVIIEKEQKNPFIITHTVIQHFMSVLSNFNAIYKKLHDVYNLLQEFNDNSRDNKKNISLIINKHLDDELEKSILYLHEPIWTNWSTSKQKIKLISNIIEDTYKNFLEYTKYDSCIIFGDPTSTDIDIALIVPSTREYNNPVNIKELKKECNLSDDKELDINKIVIFDEKVVSVQNGGINKIHDIIFYTYDLHKQKYKNPIKYPVSIEKHLEYDNARNDILAISIKILQKSYFLLPFINKYEMKDFHVSSYKSDVNKIKNSIIILNKFLISEKIFTTEIYDAMKSIIMKIIQLILLVKFNKVSYVKSEMSLLFDTYYGFDNNQSCSNYFLTRGKLGSYSNDQLKKLIDEYIIISQLYIDYKYIATEIPLNIHNFSLSHELLDLFLDDPIIFNDKFVRLIENMIPHNKSLNERFCDDKCVNYEHLDKEILNKTIIIPQRTKEWLNLRNFYFCGMNKKFEIFDGENWIQESSSLIRGSIGEKIVIDCCNFNDILNDQEPPIKISVGMIVNEINKEGSQCISPDLLLKDIMG